MSTRERIVDAAIHLFNESGTSTVSTNHIARALGISPGNLYYHFRNKEGIIHAIFDRLTAGWYVAGVLPTDRPPTVVDMRHILEVFFAIVWDYRFYYREIPSLMQRDPELAVRYRAVRRQGLANVEALLGYFVEAGVMRQPDGAGTVSDLALTCWILVDAWLPFEELGDEPIGPRGLARGVTLVMNVLRPYLSAESLAELARAESLATNTPIDRLNEVSS